MRIVTGLEPSVRLTRYPVRRLEPTFPDLASVIRGVEEDAMIRLVAHELGSADLWTLTLSTPRDTAEAKRGTPVSVTILQAEPTLRQRRVELNEYEGHSRTHHAMAEAYARREHNVPEDAVVTERPLDFGLRRTIEWWEVTA